MYQQGFFIFVLLGIMKIFWLFAVQEIVEPIDEFDLKNSQSLEGRIIHFIDLPFVAKPKQQQSNADGTYNFKPYN